MQPGINQRHLTLCPVVSTLVHGCQHLSVHSCTLVHKWAALIFLVWENCYCSAKSDAPIRSHPSLSLGITTYAPSCHLSYGSYESPGPSSECNHLFPHIAHLDGLDGALAGLLHPTHCHLSSPPDDTVQAWDEHIRLLSSIMNMGHRMDAVHWTYTRNIARGKMDPGYWVS